jgi:hypothetical protein
VNEPQLKKNCRQFVPQVINLDKKEEEQELKGQDCCRARFRAMLKISNFMVMMDYLLKFLPGRSLLE